MQTLQKKVLSVIISGIKTANRVIIKTKKPDKSSKSKEDLPKLEILIEGTGL